MMLLIGWFGLLTNAAVKLLQEPIQPWHLAAHHSYLALLL